MLWKHDEIECNINETQIDKIQGGPKVPVKLSTDFSNILVIVLLLTKSKTLYYY
jgi:hypothetical protein